MPGHRREASEAITRWSGEEWSGAVTSQLQLADCGRAADRSGGSSEISGHAMSSTMRAGASRPMQLMSSPSVRSAPNATNPAQRSSAARRPPPRLRQRGVQLREQSVSDGLGQAVARADGWRARQGRGSSDRGMGQRFEKSRGRVGRRPMVTWRGSLRKGAKRRVRACPSPCHALGF